MPLGGGPYASEQGAGSRVAHKWAGWLHNPYRLGVPTASHQGVFHNWAMRQRILASHTPPCHRRMVITT